jgi:hypothetical protein
MERKAMWVAESCENPFPQSRAYRGGRALGILLP